MRSESQKSVPKLEKNPKTQLEFPENKTDFISSFEKLQQSLVVMNFTNEITKGNTTQLKQTIHEEIEQVQRRDEMDVVTKFLTIVETQHLLGENCTKGTDFNLGEGVVDKYAQERFKLEAEVAVNRANLYTRLWKYSQEQVLMSEYLLHAEVLSLVEFDEDIFAAGNCYDKLEYKTYPLFCPFAHRLPNGKILVKDLAVEYKYLSKTAEWFYLARKNAEKVINEYSQLKNGYHSYTFNDTAHTEVEEEEILGVTYEDGRWSKPYFDCGGGNIWMMTYTVPFFGYRNKTYHFKGTSGIDIDLRRVDIDQCPLPEGSTALNIFANSDKCKKRTTKCITVPGLGFRRGSYRCVCKNGYFFPDFFSSRKYYNGSIIEEEYEKKILGEESIYDETGVFECLKCAEGCDICVDSRPCVITLNWAMRTAILILSLIIILCLPVILFFTWKFANIKVVRAASPVLLRIIIIGAFFIYSTILVLYPIPTIVSCTLRVWFREIGFSLAYGALMLKTWRISVIFRVRSAKAVKITDLDLMKRLGVIVGVFAVFMGIRTVVDPPQVIVSMTADDLKAFLCSSDWWDHSFTFMELMFLAWGIRLCIVVRKAPSEFNESKFISMAIYNEFLLSLFLNVSMIFLQSPANPDLLFIIFFCHTQLTITLLIALIFGSKVYMAIKGHGKGEDSFSMTKPMAAKFLQKPKSNSHNVCSLTSSSGCLTEGDVQDELKKLYLQLESLKEKTARQGNQATVAKIIAMQEVAISSSPPVDKIQDKDKSAKSSTKIKDSKTSSKISAGVVMKPHVNNIIANVTDKIVCATLPESPENLQKRSKKEAMTLPIKSYSTPKETSADSKIESLSNTNSSLPNLSSVERASHPCSENAVCANEQETIWPLECSPKKTNLRKIDSMEECSSPLFRFNERSIQKRRFFRRGSDLFHAIHSLASPSFALRRFRSADNFVERTLLHDYTLVREETMENFTLRSSHSTPGHSGRFEFAFDEFREIRDPERARAFILFNLTDRANITEEVTV